MTHTDVQGNELALGDVVWIAGDGSSGKTSKLVKRVVVAFTAKMIKVAPNNDPNRSKWADSLRYPHAVVKVAENIESIKYEYGIGCFYDDLETEGPHRTGMTYEDAHGWIDEFVEMSAPGNKIREVYYVIRRAKGDWEKA